MSKIPQISHDETVLISSPKIHRYDHYIIAFSGGKDSLACILNLLELGVKKEKIELWHHLIDGERNEPFMDWKITKSYVKAIAKALNLSLYYSWRIEGFKGEMLKENRMSHDILFETPTGLEKYQVKRAKITSRLKYPLLHATNLNKRWCTSILKIDVGRIAISHQSRFLNKRVLFITGERAEESLSRSKYETFEIHKLDNRLGKRIRRHVDAWRPVHKWTSEEVWDLIAKWKINPHPAYKLGWGRCSCAFCIFQSHNQFASLKEICPKQFAEVLQYEKLFDHPIHFKKQQKETIKIFLDEFAQKGTPFLMDQKNATLINSENYNEPIFLKNWINPSGRYGDFHGTL